MLSLDHVILGIDDLEKGMSEFENSTGVAPIYGGVHEKLGTHNALVSMGEGRYLEILAPRDPSHIQNPFGNFQLESLTPIGWVIRSEDLQREIEDLDAYKIAHNGISSMSRKASDGSEISWRNIFLKGQEQIAINPFYIEWGSGVTHPSEATPKGCLLEAITVSTQQEDPLSTYLMGLDLPVIYKNDSDQVGGRLLSFSLQTPNDLVTF